MKVCGDRTPDRAFSGDEDAGFEDGKGANARFNNPCGITVDAAGRIVVAEYGNDALRRVSKAGEVRAHKRRHPEQCTRTLLKHAWEAGRRKSSAGR